MGKMKDSSLLKWAQNNNKNNNKGKNKEEKNKNWIHPAESLMTGHIAYLVKFLGSTEVDQPKGIEVVKEGIRKLKFSQQIKKAEGTKTPKVELTVSVEGVAIQDPKSKKIQHQYPLHRISYCADDKAEKRFFSFIAKEEEDEKHTCFVFVSDKLAEEITLTIGQAFDLAYKKYISGSMDGKDETPASPSEEISILKSRLKELSALLTENQLKSFLEKHKISDVCEIKTSGVENLSTNGNNNKGDRVDSKSYDDDQQQQQDQLINLDAPVTKFDTMTLDDLNDDDFDPRAGDDSSDTSDDFNPRRPSFPTPVIKEQSPAPAAKAPSMPTGGFILTPPAIPPRVSNTPPVTNNPFSTPGSVQAAPNFGSPDPFGMSNFSTPNSKGFGMNGGGGAGDVFADLDPLKK
eukprot:TRINITY_DN11561_c0_g1_i1.p1 TRINITY_DN11561_c0_g1~~TRINITY_DN11561_c0_g1_i1.p1  ORF type:complete len:404 (+),score=126.70 TRINITY_DN11561_c0_g1_i1:248-1459(+)